MASVDFGAPQEQIDRRINPDGTVQPFRDRPPAERKQLFAECAEAWRVNAIARRILALNQAFVFGSGWSVVADDDATNDYLQYWLNDDAFGVQVAVAELFDELVRIGNAFLMLSHGTNGIFVRSYPAELIDEIETADNDIRTVRRYRTSTPNFGTGPTFYPYRSDKKRAGILHFTENRPAGGLWGEGDFGTLLIWLKRHNQMMEDRVRNQHLRNLYSFVLGGIAGQDDNAVKARQRELALTKPVPGSFFFLRAGETLEIVNPNVQSNDVTGDLLAIKKHIALAAGIPLFWLAEPESSTRTTATESSTPTFRLFSARQKRVVGIIENLARYALIYRSKYDIAVNPLAKITVTMQDTREGNNLELAQAVGELVSACLPLLDKQIITPDQIKALFFETLGKTL